MDDTSLVGGGFHRRHVSDEHRRRVEGARHRCDLAPEAPRAGYPRGILRASRCFTLISAVTGCHITSGLDDLTINRLEPGAGGMDQYACEPIVDELEAIDADRWNVLKSGGGIDVDILNDGLHVATTAEVASNGRGGLVSVEKYNLEGCVLTAEVSDTTSDPSSYTMLAAFVEPEDAEPLVALRKQRGQLVGALGDRDIDAVGFNQAQRFWRIRERNGQIIFEHSELGEGAWERVTQVQTPFEARGVHVVLAAGTSMAGVEEEVLFDMFEMSMN